MANERLAAFLFRLARDEVPTGVIEEHVRVVQAAHAHGEPVTYVEDAEHLGNWAHSVAARLVPVRPDGGAP